MALNLGAILYYFFPDTVDDGWRVQQDPDTGEHFISMWDESVMGRPLPTTAEIESWEFQAAKGIKAQEIRRDFVGESQQAASPYELVGVPSSDARVVAHSERVKKLRTLEQQLASASTVQAVQAINW